jgi:hypothetical protein
MKVLVATAETPWEVGTVVERDIWAFEAHHGSASKGGTLPSWVVLIA